jgi:hypothetical protein
VVVLAPMLARSAAGTIGYFAVLVTAPSAALGRKFASPDREVAVRFDLRLNGW